MYVCKYYFLFRGMFGASGALSVSAGITLVFVFGASLPNWRWVCVACGAIPIIVIGLMPFLPETPNWLVMKGKREDAYKVTKNRVTYRTHLRIDRGLYLCFINFCRYISLKFGGISLMLCGLYMREVNFRERFILKCALL